MLVLKKIVFELTILRVLESGVFLLQVLMSKVLIPGVFVLEVFFML